MIQYTQINKHNRVPTQNQGKKTHEYFNTCRKTFDKIQHPFMIKALKKLRIKKLTLSK
jgi:hypothetical protein